MTTMNWTRARRGNSIWQLQQQAPGRADRPNRRRTDENKRNAMIAEAFELHADDVGHLPLHQQALAWGMKKNVELVQLADNYHWLKWVTVR